MNIHVIFRKLENIGWWVLFSALLSSSLNVWAQEEFYEKIADLYSDQKTKEVVFIRTKGYEYDGEYRADTARGVS